MLETQDIVMEGEETFSMKEKTVGGKAVLPWVEKYRPTALNEVVVHHDIIKTIETFVEKNRLPHLLFHGPPGTGKTSTIVACAKNMYGKSYKSMVLELNASDERGIDTVREEIKGFVSALPVFQTHQMKMVILDEADNMTSAAQFALRRLIEQYSGNSRFCLVCNYVNRIIPALQSRCTKFRFGPLSDDDVQNRVTEICKFENVDLKPDGRAAILKIGQGDMRKILNVLQATSLAFDSVDEEAVFLTTGIPLPRDIETILNCFLTQTLEESCSVVQKMKTDKGYALNDILAGLYVELLKWNFPASVTNELFVRLADIEYRMCQGANEKIQLVGLAGLFIQCRSACQQLKN